MSSIPNEEVNAAVAKAMSDDDDDKAEADPSSVTDILTMNVGNFHVWDIIIYESGTFNLMISIKPCPPRFGGSICGAEDSHGCSNCDEYSDRKDHECIKYWYDADFAFANIPVGIPIVTSIDCQVDINDIPSSVLNRFTRLKIPESRDQVWTLLQEE